MIIRVIHQKQTNDGEIGVDRSEELKIKKNYRALNEYKPLQGRPCVLIAAVIPYWDFLWWLSLLQYMFRKTGFLSVLKSSRELSQC